jgi:hypothetical protein
MTISPTPTVTLESVQADFQQWRQHKVSPKSRIPDELRQKALALLADHPSSQLQKALGVSHAMLKAWAGKTAQNGANLPQPIEFVTLPVEQNPASCPANALQLEVTHPNGDRWGLQGNLSPSLLSAFVRALSGGAQCSE